MRLILSLIIAFSCVAIGADAQTYLEHVQQVKSGKGRVVVTQSKEIDKLVNGSGNAASQVGQTAPGDGSNNKKNVNVPGTGNPQSAKSPTVSGKDTSKIEGGVTEKKEDPNSEAIKAEAARKESEARALAEARRKAEMQKAEEEAATTVVDTRKKLMRGSRKVSGYRVQAFAGGNTRNDKQRAQQIGNDIKMKFPDQPVYVHFYSPRWICRIGNFRSYQEAQRVLKQVRAMGYGAATIVKGQITVQY